MMVIMLMVGIRNVRDDCGENVSVFWLMTMIMIVVMAN
jgi:hypothetical protein